MAIQTEPTRIQIPFADSGTKNVIPDTNSTPSASQAASWTDGFPAQCSLPLSAGGIPPARADFNGILNAMTQSERFAQEGGVWAWDATVDYASSRVVLGSDGKLYWSVAQSGPNVGGAQDPTTDNGTYWQAMPMDDADVVHKAGIETITGEKTFANRIVLVGYDPTVPGTESNAICAKSTGDEMIVTTAGAVNDNTQGAKIVLYGTTHLTNPGRFLLTARDSNGVVNSLVGDTDKLKLSNNNTYGFSLHNNGLDITNPPNRTYYLISQEDKNDVNCGGVYVYQATTQGEINLHAVSNGGNSSFSVGLRTTSSSNGFIPGTSNQATLGNSSRRWSEVFANNGSINTSDARLKTAPEAVPDAVLDAWGDVDFVQFQMLDSVEKKGADKARLHNGLIAQRIDEAFKARGLDASRYGLFCWDEWEAEPEKLDENGRVLQAATPAGECYSLRYEEALCMEAAYQRRRADRAEARLAALEERLAAIEAKIG